MTRGRALWWLLGAETVSLLGSRVTFVAVPWLVLETTGARRALDTADSVSSRR